MKHFLGYEKRKRAFRRFKMLRGVALLVVVCLLAFAFAMSSTQEGRAYYPDETHAPLIDKASEGYQLDDWLNMADFIKAGVVAEDIGEDIVYHSEENCKFNSHFWDPDNGGLWAESDSVPLDCTGDELKNSLHKAIALTAMALSDYRNGYYADSYTKLGHVAHLLQDQSVPAHAHEHNHFEYDIGIYYLDWYDYYEYDMKTLDDLFTWDGNDSIWNFPSTPSGLIDFPDGFCTQFSENDDWRRMWEIDEWKNYLTFPLPEEPPCPNCVSMQYDQDGKVAKPCDNAYGLGLAKIAYLMYTTNQYADWWASFNNLNLISPGDGYLPYFGDKEWIDYNELKELGWDNQTLWPSKVQAHYNYRYAMRATATLFQVFEEMTKPNLKPTLTVNRYVKQDATGNCTSWDEACDLQAALAGPETNYEIWVAKGEYYPGDPGNRQAAFILKDGVAIYGGFTGDETSRAQRDWETNLTILSGDIGVVGDNSDNSYHVVSAVGLTETATLDGFTIIGGNADASTFPEQWGGGLYAENSNLAIRHVSFKGNSAAGGGGMFINGDGQPVVLENVEFFSNTATVNGGGLHTYNGSDPTLINVTFSGNSAASYGGGIINFADSDPSLVNVIFSGNTARYGGGMFNYDNSAPTLVNVAFSGNSAEVGGGMYNNSSPNLTNVTFSGNSAIYHGGGMDNQGENTPVLTNCILWGNTAPNGAQIYNGTGSSAAINYSDIQGGWDGIGNIDQDPQFMDADGDDDIPGTLDDNLHLQFTSPAIDAGENSALLAEVTADLDGSLRIINGTVDMGAYEMTHPPIYVDQADLAIGVPGEDLKFLGNEHGAVNVLFGTTSGLSTEGNQLWHQDFGVIEDELDSNDLFGSALAVSDFNGDGYSDLAIGVPGEDLKFWGNEHGAVNVLYGTASGLSDTNNQFWTQDSPGVKGDEEAESNDSFGSALASGDFDGDGYYDLAIGVPGENGEKGGVNLLYGSASRLSSTGNQFWTQDSTGVKGDGGDIYDRFGSVLTSGDFNGDGVSDLAIGVPGEDLLFLGNEHGAVNVLYGTASGLSAEGNQFWHQDIGEIINVLNSNDLFGSALAAGDFDGDGYSDLAIGVPGEDITILVGGEKHGAVNVLYGTASGLSDTGNQFWTQNSPGINDEVAESNDRFGSALTSGDFNGDGYYDLAIGVPGESGDMGVVNLLYGSAFGLTANGNQILSQGSPGVEEDVMEENDQFGFALASGDLNGDGIDDLAVGVPYENIDLIVDAGAVHVFYGSLTGLTTDGNHLLHQGNLTGDLDPFDLFGYALAIGKFNAAHTPPVALADAYSTDEDIPLSVDPEGVLTNDTDVDGDSLTAVLDTDVSNGTLTLNADGSFDYIPHVDFNGSDSFTYHANDRQADSNTVTVTITVNPVNDAPVVENTSNSGPIQEGGSATITVSAYDVDGGSLSYRFDCDNDGTFEVGPQPENTASCSFADNGSYTVGVEVDDTSTSSSDSTKVIVDNVAPSVSPAEDQTIPLGYTDALPLGSFIDPGSQDAPWAIKVDWGDGSTPNSWSISAVGDLNPLTHSFSSAGWYTVEVTVTDKDGEPGSAEFQITVENPAPEISAINPLAVLAGGSTDFSLQIFGSDLVSTSKIRWGGVEVDTTFVSENEIQAIIPFGLIETARTAEITVYNPEPGGGISAPMAFFVTEINVTVDDYSAATSTDPGVPATTSTENTAVEANGGTGTVVVAEFSDNPFDETLIKSSKNYFDIYLSSDSSFQQVEITINNVNNGSSLSWWDGEHWLKIEKASYNPVTNSVTFIITAATVPSIEQLSGTVFGLVDDAPYEASASLYEQKGQFSDSIIPIALEARDAGDGVMTAKVDLPWLNISEAICSMDGNNTICTWTLTGTANVPAGSYEANVNVFDSAQNQVEIPTISIIVSPEDTATIFHSGNPVAVKVTEDGGTSGLFELEVRVKETYPDNVPDGSTSYPGDISLGQVSMKLVPVGPGGEVNGDCSLIGVFDEGYDAFQRVVCSFDAVPVNTYLATITVDGGYYAGLGEEVLVVYDPSRGYTTGGGWFYWPDTLDRTSFGFTMEYNNTGSNVKGSMLLIRHLENGSIYQIKSNALYGISLGVKMEEGETFGWATFSGKATYLEPGWIEAIGNHEYMIYVEDRNEPGSGVDQFWIEVRDKTGNIIALMSMPRPAIDNTEPLSEGNIFVPH